MNTSENRALDCTFRKSGPLIWYMRRYKPGDRCWAWCFWNMRWDRVEIVSYRPLTTSFKVKLLDIPTNDGGCAAGYSEDYRMRPIWWFWARRAVVVAAIYSIWHFV